MEVKLTTDWILMHNSEVYCIDGECHIKINDGDFQYYLTELAMKTLNVPYECQEYYYEDDENWEHPWYQYSFENIEDIKEKCPELYAEFKSLIEQDNLRRQKILRRHNFIIDFLETPKTSKEIEEHMENNLYRTEEEDFENRKDSLKVHTKYLLDELIKKNQIKLLYGCYMRTQ